MVVSKVASAMGDGLEHGDAGYETVSRRIESLVSKGRLLARGNIKNWRFSFYFHPSIRLHSFSSDMN